MKYALASAYIVALIGLSIGLGLWASKRLGYSQSAVTPKRTGAMFAFYVLIAGLAIFLVLGVAK
jgi:hypothetical protein